MRWRPLSLRRRVIASGTLVVAVLVLALDVFVYVSLRDRMLDNLESVLDAREQLVLGLDEELTPEQIAVRLDEVGIRAVVRTPRGDEYLSAGAPAFDRLPPVQPQEQLVSRRVPLADGVIAIVLASRGGIDTTLNRLLLIAATGTVVVIGLAVALFARLSSRVLRPVRDVATTAGHIASGRVDERLVVREDDDELREMVSTFNAMLDALESAVQRSNDAEQVSRRFLADAAHQLRTPVAGIRASVGAMVRSDDPEERERLLDNLAAEAARMSRLLSSLLRVARLDSHEELSFERHRLRPLLDAVVERQRPRAPRLDLEVVGIDDLAADVDAAGIEEAVANLLDNAVRYARRSIVVELDGDDVGATIRVRDDGPGIADADVDAVFERFVSLGPAGGSGLGLPIARGVADSHHGSLDYRDGAFVLRVPTRRTTCPN